MTTLASAIPGNRSLFRNTSRAENTEYKQADGDEKYGLMHGTIIPTAKDGVEHSGFRGSVLPDPASEILITKDLGNGKGMVTLSVSARAMEILKFMNSRGGKISFEDAIEAEAAEKVTGVMAIESEPPTYDSTPPPAEPVQTSADPVGVAAMVAKVSPGAKRAAKKPVPQAAVEITAKPVKKIPVKFFSSWGGTMTIQADRAFIGGPGDICLVLVQDCPSGDFFIPPQSEEPISVSLNGAVYKCLTGTYYQIPGTSLMHVIYFIHREEESDEPREA